jgi:hypothetical protein
VVQFVPLQINHRWHGWARMNSFLIRVNPCDPWLLNLLLVQFVPLPGKAARAPTLAPRSTWPMAFCSMSETVALGHSDYWRRSGGTRTRLPSPAAAN